MDFAWYLLNNHRTRSAWCRPWWNIKYYCRNLRADCRCAIHNQSLTFINPVRAQPSPKRLCPYGIFSYSQSPKLDVSKRISLLVSIILLLTAQWLFSFFGQSILPGVPYTGSFIYMLSILIVILIIMKFLSQV